MKITFLGTGGGRFNLVHQILKTGGFRVDSKSASIHVDPGPGALVYSNKLGLNLLDLDAIIVTHLHVDHSSDAGPLIEAMTNYANKKQGILIGSKYSIEGSIDRDRSISKYHISKVENVWSAKKEEKRKFKTKKGSFELQSILVQHDEPTAIGFKLFIDGKVIGCTGDTELFDGIFEKFSNCDYLIVHCLKPNEDGIPDHLKLADAIELIKNSKPKKAFIIHRGAMFKKLGYNIEKLKQIIEKETNVETIVPNDFESFTL